MITSIFDNNESDNSFITLQSQWQQSESMRSGKTKDTLGRLEGFFADLQILKSQIFEIGKNARKIFIKSIQFFTITKLVAVRRFCL